MNDLSNQELKSALAEGELSPRKQAIGKEVLRRRYERAHCSLAYEPATYCLRPSGIVASHAMGLFNFVHSGICRRFSRV